jgi:hypothetical protein
LLSTTTVFNTPLDSMREAVFIASPKIEYLGSFVPASQKRYMNCSFVPGRTNEGKGSTAQNLSSLEL